MKNDIHPRKKEPVGNLLALFAEYYVYQCLNLFCKAPQLTGNQIILCGASIHADVPVGVRLYQCGWYTANLFNEEGIPATTVF